MKETIELIDQQISKAYSEGLVPSRLILGAVCYNDLKEHFRMPAYMALGEYKGILILIDPVNKERIYCEGNIPKSSRRIQYQS